jgi:hypothetical protein
MSDACQNDKDIAQYLAAWMNDPRKQELFAI